MPLFRRINPLLAVAATSTLLSLSAIAADTMGDQTFTNANDIKWGNAPPSLPKGAKVAVLYGDPGKPGPFVTRLMAPADTRFRPTGTRRPRTSPSFRGYSIWDRVTPWTPHMRTRPERVAIIICRRKRTTTRSARHPRSSKFTATGLSTSPTSIPGTIHRSLQ